MTGTSPSLRQSLASRHVAMISVGGVIGSGLFVGSSAAIAATGPAVVISYALAGLLVLAVMRLLAEMAKGPPRGSFTEYIRDGLGDIAGGAAGWLYWYFWVLALALEAYAGAIILQQWIAWPEWQLGLGLLAALTALNLVSTRAFGEAEFWLSLLKVLALLAFLAIGAVFLAGWLPVATPGLSHLHGHGGFAPNGLGAVLAGVTTVVFALVGVEIVAVAAAESHAPDRVIARMMSTLVVRIGLFFLLSMLVIVAIVPWNQIAAGSSPFALALERAGLPVAAKLMDGVILVAVLSCLNAGFYVASRVLFVLAAKGDAPRALVILNASGVPVRSVALSAGLAALALLGAIVVPDGLFSFLVSASGALMLLLYMLLALAFLRSGPASAGLKAAGLFAVSGIAAVLAAMALTPAQQGQIVAGAVLVAGVTGIVACFRRRQYSRA